VQREVVTSMNMKSRLFDLTFNIILRMVANRRLWGAVYSEEFQKAHHFKEMIEEAFFLLKAFEVGDFASLSQLAQFAGSQIHNQKNAQEKRRLRAKIAKRSPQEARVSTKRFD
ncbi:hypothetical protein KI387_035870, partial [Taxus chinensis]